MNLSSTIEDRLRIYAWIWEACIAFDYKNELVRVEKEVEDVEYLRKFIVDATNASFLIAFWKLQSIYKKLDTDDEILETLTDFQYLTLELLEDSNLHSVDSVVTSLMCFHHYCILMLFEAEREYSVDILLPSLPLSQQNWERIKSFFKFKDDTFQEDIVKITSEFVKCRNDMERRDSDEELFQSYYSSILSRLGKFCCDIRKLLSTPTLVLISKNDIADTCYKCFRIPHSELIVKQIKEHGVTEDSIRIILDLLLFNPKPQENHLKPGGLDAASPESLCNTLHITHVIDKPANAESLSQNPSGGVAESKRIVNETRGEGDAECLPKSSRVTDAGSQVEKCAEILSELIRTIKRLPQMVNRKNLESEAVLLDDLVKDVKKVSQITKNLKTSSYRVAEACSEHEKVCSEFLKSVTKISEENKIFSQVFKVESLCQAARNAIISLNSGNDDEPDGKMVNSTFIEDDPIVSHDLSAKDTSRSSELSLPVLTPQVPLSASKLGGSFDKDSMPNLTPQKDLSDKSASSNTPQKFVSTNSTPRGRSSDSETFKKRNSYEQSPVMNDDEEMPLHLSDSIFLSVNSSATKGSEKKHHSSRHISNTDTCDNVVSIESCEQNEKFSSRTSQKIGRNLSISSKKSFGLNETTEQRTVYLSCQSNSQDDTSDENDLDEMKTDKNERARQRICDISPQRSSNDSTNHKNLNVILPSSLSLNPRVVLEPLKDSVYKGHVPTSKDSVYKGHVQTSDSPTKINDTSDDDDTQLSSERVEKDISTENVEARDMPVIYVPDSPLPADKPRNESPDYDLNRLIKRRRISQIDTSYSEEEV